LGTAGLDTTNTAYGPVRQCREQCNKLNKIYTAHILHNYITYVIHHTNLLHTIFIY